MKIIYTQKALHDLERLRDFISQENHLAAKKIAHNIVSAIKRLKDFPQQGRQVRNKQQTIDEIRDLIIGKYIVRYLILQQEIHVLRLWHGKENWTNC